MVNSMGFERCTMDEPGLWLFEGVEGVEGYGRGKKKGAHMRVGKGVEREGL